MSQARRRVEEILRGMRVHESEAEAHLAQVRESIFLVEAAIAAWCDADLDALATDVVKAIPELVPS